MVFRFKNIFIIAFIIISSIQNINNVYADLDPVISLNKSENRLNIDTNQNIDDFQDCVGNGLELSCQYTFKPCIGKRLWFDSCKSEKVAFKSVNFIPIEGIYKISVDFINDKKKAEIIQTDSYDLALKQVLTFNDLNLNFIFKEGIKFFEKKNSYLDTRIVCSCKGEYNRSIAGIAEFITLGLAEFSAYDSGSLRYTP